MNRVRALIIAVCIIAVAATGNALIYQGDCQNSGTFQAYPNLSNGICICDLPRFGNTRCHYPCVCSTNNGGCGAGMCNSCECVADQLDGNGNIATAGHCNTPNCDCSRLGDPTGVNATALGTCTGDDPLGLNGPSTICNDYTCPGCDANGICDGCNNFLSDCSGCVAGYTHAACALTDPPTCDKDCNTRDLS